MTAAGSDIGNAGTVTGPVHAVPGDDGAEPAGGVGLCLSGGGYRAMLFHLGTLWRLNDAGWLRRVDRISSVSGGSITAGALGVAWNGLTFDGGGVATDFREQVAARVLELATHTIDYKSVLIGAITPHTIAEEVAAAYDRYVLKKAKLAALPDSPTFVFNATNLESGVLFRFTKRYLADWRVGRVADPDLPVSSAVAASSAFPPFLAPFRLDLSAATWITDPGNTLTGPGYRGDLHLCDGGVYDNLGIETAWKRCRTLIVSDAGAALHPDPDPHDDWARETVRVFGVIDDQVRALRTRQVLDSFENGTRDGAYVGIRSDITQSGAADPLPAPFERTQELARTRTRLARLDTATINSLVNWGYAAADAGMRARVDRTLPVGQFPLPGGVTG